MFTYNIINYRVIIVVLNRNINTVYTSQYFNIPLLLLKKKNLKNTKVLGRN